MAHLVDTYARTAGLRIDKPLLFEHFFPLPVEEDYIVFVASAGHAVRFYSFYREVLWLLKDALQGANIKTVQCGLKEDPKIGCDIDVCGLTDPSQLFHIISRAKLLICGDTGAMHVADAFDVPLVALFSTSEPKISGPYFGNKSKQICLSPRYSGYAPSHNAAESPKTIDKIQPEWVADSAAKLLGLYNRRVNTISMGAKFGNYSIDVVPDSPYVRQNLDGVLLNLRYDIGGDERIVHSLLSKRKCLVVTNKAMDVNILKQLRGNLENLLYEVDDNYDINFIAALKIHAIPFILTTEFSKEKLDGMKEVFMDYGLVQRKKNFTREAVTNHDQISERTKFRSSKFIISQGRIFMSRAHLEADSSIDDFSDNEAYVIDDPLFWREQEFFYLFNDAPIELKFPNHPIIPRTDAVFD